MKYFYLELLSGADQGGICPLLEGRLTLGRSPENDLVFPPNETSVSSRQAELHRAGDVLTLIDLQSRNGTFVNGERISEKTLRPGDEVRFGRNGPRLRLLSSSVDLLTEAETSPTPVAPDPAAPSPSRLAPADPDGLPAAGPRTVFFEVKLQDGTIEAQDLQHLLHDGKRLERILARGNVGQSQAGLLRSSAQASQKARRRALGLLLFVLLLGAGATAHFAIKAHQYEETLARGLSLEDALDRIETEIAKADSAPEQNQDRLKKLMEQLETTRGQLAEVKQTLKVEDQKKLYTNPVEERIERMLQGFGDKDYHIPLKMVERVSFYLEMFSKRAHGSTALWLKRRDQYFPKMAPVFERYNLPKPLLFIAMNESGLDPEALSAVGARGIWQLMPGTARQYGLQVNDVIDERILPEKATDASARFLQDLIAIFGSRRDVMLVMAAYNAGEGRLMRALRQIDDPVANRDFWYMYRMGLLAEETNEYVPRVLSLMIISEDPAAFGFNAPPLIFPAAGRDE